MSVSECAALSTKVHYFVPTDGRQIWAILAELVGLDCRVCAQGRRGVVPNTVNCVKAGHFPLLLPACNSLNIGSGSDSLHPASRNIRAVLVSELVTVQWCFFLAFAVLKSLKSTRNWFSLLAMRLEQWQDDKPRSFSSGELTPSLCGSFFWDVKYSSGYSNMIILWDSYFGTKAVGSCAPKRKLLPYFFAVSRCPKLDWYKRQSGVTLAGRIITRLTYWHNDPWDYTGRGRDYQAAQSLLAVAA